MRPLPGTLALLLALSTPADLRAQGLFEEALEEAEAEGAPAGEESGDAASAPAPSRGPTLELGGRVRGAAFVGEAFAGEGPGLHAGYGELALTARGRHGKRGSAFAELRLRAGHEYDAAFSGLELREAYLDLFLGPLDLRLGHQIIAWGRADGLNPTDVLSPKNMGMRSADPDDRRAAALALRTQLYLEPMKLELVWLPAYFPSRFPPFQLPGPITLVEPAWPDARLENGTAAARLHLETSALEASVSYVHGHAPFPGLRLHSFTLDPANTESPASLGAGFEAYRQHLVGLDFATALGTLAGLRGEAALRLPLESEVKDDAEWIPLPDLQWIVGLDREVATNLTVVVQYVGRHVLEWDGLESKLGPLLGGDEPPDLTVLLDSLEPDERTAFLDAMVRGETPALVYDEIRLKTRMVQGQSVETSHALGLVVRWMGFHDTVSIDLAGQYNLSTEEWMLRPALDWDLADGLSLRLGAELYHGPDDTLFGLMDSLLSAGFVEVSGSF
ncbi:MAG: hypothetical protein P1V51_17440 [Deltaproteobacteria bacterium]|nr:hypothetical protein [Deltaproteobacteria bacterium]